MIELHGLSSADQILDTISSTNKTCSFSHASETSGGSCKELSLNFVSDLCVHS